MNGKLVLSLDFELLWGLAGWNKKQVDSYLPNIKRACLALDEILSLFKKYDLKCTIAFVGAMNHISFEDLVNRNEVLFPSYEEKLFSSFYSFFSPAVVGRYPDSLCFAYDIIEKLKTNVDVELASHTYSHYYCLERGQAIQSFERDIKYAVENASQSGLHLSTIIFPRNQVTNKYLNVCANYGLTHYRGMLGGLLYSPDKTRFRYSWKGALRFLDAYINISGYNTYDLSTVQGTASLINVPGSRFFRPYSKVFSLLEKLKLQRIKKSMRHAALTGEIYHLWWHPHNFGENTDKNLRELESLCRYYKFLHEKYNYQSIFISELK